MARTEVLISGFGGQGVVRIGQTLGLAGVKADLNATMLKSHGTETRGGYVRTQVVLSDGIIDSMATEHPAIFVAMSKAAYQKFYKLSGVDSIIFYDPAYVEPVDDAKGRQIPIPARKLSMEHFGKELFTNMIIYGKVIRSFNGLISVEAAKNALVETIPRAIDDNLKAFDLGYDILDI